MDAAASGLALINRSPDEDETGALVTTNIQLDIADLTALGIDLALTDIYVDAVLAYDGATDTFQTGFDGAASARTAPDADTTRLVIDPTTPFTSLDLVTVRVVANTVGAGNPIDISYTFTVQDLTPPELVAASARELKVVRLTFDEAVKQVSASGSDDALNPANYVFTPLTFPAVTPVVSSVASVSTTSVDLTTDIDISPGKQYSIEAEGVADLLGNQSTSPTNIAFFVGIIPPIPAGRRFDLFRFLPQINRDEDVTRELEDFVSCLQEVTNLLLYDIDRFTDILDPAIAPLEFIDAMLCDLGNPFDFEDLSEIDKRRLIDVLVAIYKQKGTGVGIINAVRFFVGVEVTIDAFNATGWILGEDELGVGTILAPGLSFEKYSFTIISPVVLTAEQRTRITFIANFMKPGHTHLIEIIEPGSATVDHWELGVSQLGDTTDLH
jgi:phage tail-like protein